MIQRIIEVAIALLQIIVIELRIDMISTERVVKPSRNAIIKRMIFIVVFYE
jgi:hypothetical protein